jgi:hypothetical protein
MSEFAVRTEAPMPVRARVRLRLARVRGHVRSQLGHEEKTVGLRVRVPPWLGRQDGFAPRASR